MASEMNMLLEKATSPLLLEVDITNTLQIVDLIRQNDVSAKVAVQCIFTRLKDKNPNVVLMTLQVLESVVKNCGEGIHEEVCSRNGCLAMEELISGNTNEEVRNAACYLLGSWCSVFKGQPKLQAVQDLVNILRAKGHRIPSSSEAAALYSADAAPDWADANCCHRCRSNFTIIKRKHHCRACGQVFCGECSNRSSNIPKFGIEKEVRVCETCYHEINSPTPGGASKAKAKEDVVSSPAKKSTAAPPAGGKSEAELQEEEEFQLALALSKSEAENKEKEKLRVTHSLLSGPGWRNTSSSNNGLGGVSAPPHSPSPPLGIANDEEAGELAKYLNRSYWEQQKQQSGTSTSTTATSTASSKGSTLSSVLKNRGSDETSAPFSVGALDGGPIRAASPLPHATAFPKATEALQMSNENEVSEFVATFQAQLEIFVNRMKSNQSRGRPIANDTSVQGLFVNITTMHGQLLQYLQQQEAKRVWYEQLQDKLSQTRDARAALEALREEHREREKREREEQQRIRQMQMMQKLEVMRKKKQEYLEYQRQLAVHRMAQTERQLMQHQQPPPHQQAMQAPPPQPFYGQAQPMGPPTLQHGGVGAMDQQHLPQNMGAGQQTMPGGPPGAFPPVMGGYDGAPQQQSPYLPYMGPPPAAYFTGNNGGAPPPPPPFAPPVSQPDPALMMMQQQQMQQQPLPPVQQQQQQPLQPLQQQQPGIMHPPAAAQQPQPLEEQQQAELISFD